MNNQPKQAKPKPKKSTKNRRPKPKSAKSDALGSTTSRQESVAAAYSRKRVTGKPAMKHLPNGDAIIEHTEFISDVFGSILFVTSQFPVQPGISGSFPWLSQIAPNYESYLFEKLDYEYQNSCGSTTSGKVMLAVDYDASDPAPVSKLQLASYQDYASEIPWRDFTQHNRMENLRKQKSYFVRDSAVPANSDVKLYDVGNLSVATQGMADATAVGELYVHYRVRFMTPQIQNPAVGTSKSATFSGTASIVKAALSNAPLTVTGSNASYIITASAPYDCVVTSVSNAASGGAITYSGTATRSSATVTSSGTIAMGNAQVQFLAGSTLQVDTAGTGLGSAATYCGQFNVTGI